MAEQHHATGSRKVGLSSHIPRGNRLGELLQGRSPPASSMIDDGSSAQTTNLGQNMSSPSQDIWGRPSISSTIAATFKNSHNDSAYISPVASTFEQKHGSSSLHPSDYDAWANPNGKTTRAWNGETSPVMSSSHMTDGLNRSPVRTRGTQSHETVQSITEDHASSPYSVFMTQQSVAARNSLVQSPSNKTMLDSSTGFVEPFGLRSPGFGNGSTRFGADASYTYPSQGSGFSGNNQAAVHAPSFVPSFAITRNQYDDLTRETREAEILASQFRQMSIDQDEKGKFSSAARRAQFGSFPQMAQGNFAGFSTQPPQFGDLGQYARQPIIGMEEQNSWIGEEASYTANSYGNESLFAEGGYLGGNTQRSGDLLASPRTDQMTQSAPMSPTQLLLREQAYNRAQFGVTYPFNQFRMPIESSYGIALNGQALGNQGLRRADDYPQNLRSSLLEEFRSNQKGNKRYELRDIYTHVVEFSGDQHGSRFIQQKIETANSDEKEMVFQEIRANCLQLMTDVFGNYVIQKFFEHGSQLQKSLLAKQMEGHVLTLSLQMYGCRVVQKALEHILVDQQASLVKELDGHVLKCVKDQNGNHVVQKAIERVPAEHIQFIINAFTGQVNNLATHPYGCRVIQRMLEHCDEEAQASLLAELHVNTYTLVQDQYGNYVTQHVIEHGEPEDRAKIIQLVTTQLLHFSKHKFASNVVEKSIVFGSDEQRREIVKVITNLRSDGSSPLQVLMRDQYGNYVIQKLLMQLKGKDWDVLADQVKPQLLALKKYTHGKQINAIEKLIFNSSSSPKSRSASPPKSQTITPPPSSGTTTPPPANSQSSRTVDSSTSSTSASQNTAEKESGTRRHSGTK